MKRQAGILCSVTSLPSRFGVGDFGPSAYRFVDLLAEAGLSFWQILPLNPIGYGHSPYQPYSSFALDEQFIDLLALKKEGHIASPLPKFDLKAKRVDYEAARAAKLPLLYEAFLSERKARPSAIKSFAKKHPFVEAWSLFSLFHRRYARSWEQWPEEAKFALQNKIKLSEQDEVEREFEIYLQMKAYAQWDALHAYAKKKGIQIIGDLPFYVGYDSCDFWANQNMFRLGEDLAPSHIAGVPPDYFSETGQRWGNPIYDWEALEESDFAFLHDRILGNAKIYDVLRLDHFRAFDTFWKIPAWCETAIEGEWIEAPGYAFFDSLFRKAPSLKKNLIAEDLGDLRPEVLVLRDHFAFPGMNVIEFTFHDDQIAKRAFWNATNSVVYLGTHDNEPMASFYSSLDKEEKAKWAKALKGIAQPTPTKKLMEFALKKKSKWVIFSLQDLLEQGNHTRMNSPSTVNDVNWTYRLPSLAPLKAKLKWLGELLKATKRSRL